MSRLFLNAVKQPFFTQLRFRRLKKKKPIIDDLAWAEPLIAKHGKEPDIQEPAQLHMVYLMRTLRTRPFWEKDAAKKLGLTEIDKIVVHKNIAEINDQLTTIKHLIRVVPITFPYGLPDSEDDYAHCYLRDNGEFVVQKNLNPLSVTSREMPEASRKTLDTETVKRVNTLKLNNFLLGQEYFPAKYQYKHNQDGKEFRYKGNQNINSDRDWY